MAVVVALVIAVALGLAFRGVQQGIGRTRQTNAVVKSMFELKILMGDYERFGVERARNQWVTRHASLGELLAGLDLDAGEQVLLRDRLKDNHEKLASLFEQFVMAHAGRSASNGAVSLPASQRAIAHMDVTVMNMIADANRLSTSLSRGMEKLQRRAAVAVALSTLVMMVLVIGSSVLVGRSVVRPLAVLQEGTAIIGDGNLDYKLAMAADDEVGELSRAFDAMTDRLKTTTASRDELALEVAERQKAEARLEETLSNLERSNRELEQFAYVASHDLQEPLRKIVAFGELLQTECADGVSGDGADYLARMYSAVRRMQNLISDLLNLSRVTSKARPFVPVDMNAVAREVVSDLEPRLHETGGSVEVSELPTLDADPMQMHQLLQNLIGNALKFGREGVPPRVVVSAVDPQAKGGGNADSVAIQVSDNGIGFDQKYAERIFGVFQRLHGRGAYEGCGIGLAICRKIVTRHGGGIGAVSRPGEGAAFTIRLPRQPPVADIAKEA